MLKNFLTSFSSEGFTWSGSSRLHLLNNIFCSSSMFLLLCWEAVLWSTIGAG